MRERFWSKGWSGPTSRLAGGAVRQALRGQLAVLMVVLVASLALEACSRREEDKQQETQEQAAKAAQEAIAARVPTPVTASGPIVETVSETELLYRWEMPGEVRQADTLIQGERTQLKTRTYDALKVAQDDEKAAKENGYPFRRHVTDTRWWVSAETPDLLALEGMTYTDQGGAHPNTILHGMVVDKSAKRQVTDLYSALFTDTTGAQRLVKRGFCEELDRQRAQKRQGQAGTSIGAFGACPDFSKEQIPLTLVGAVGESSATVVRGKLAAVRAVVSPYTAGPYAEGSYIVDVPLTGALASLVKPELQPLLVSTTTGVAAK